MSVLIVAFLSSVASCVSWVGFAGSALAAGPGVRVSDLMTCYRQLRPYSTTGSHATVYPTTDSLVFIHGQDGTQSGLWIYDDSGAAFAAVDPGLQGKTVAFDFAFESNGGKSSQTVIYQPASGGHGDRVWVRPFGSAHGSGVTLAFNGADDAQKRAPFEAELEQMVRGMSNTWDSRERELVKAVNEGRYLWVDVDLDDYREAATKCAGILNQDPETASLRNTIQSELGELKNRANQSGVVRDVRPSTFMGSPQY